MDEVRLNRRDGLFIAVCLVVLVAGVVVGLKYFHKAFPEASIDFRYDRAQTGEMATAFLGQQGLTPPAGYRHVSRFGYDGGAKTYLEKELGLDSAQRYFGNPVRLWFWQHRWFKPGTKEEYQVFVTPAGEVARLTHELEETTPGADLPETEARVLAERFLYRTMQRDSAGLVFIEARRIGRPARGDWMFTWRAAGIEPVEGSEYRYQVGVLGDRVGSYREFLKVPEAWQASFSRLRSFNEIAGAVASVGFLLTIIAMIIVLFLRLRRRDVRWRIAIYFGLVAAALTLLNQINTLPLSLYGYDTTASWPGYITRTVLESVLATLGSGLFIFLLTAGAEPLYRERYGEKLALSRMFSVRALRTKRAFKNVLLGVTLTSFFFAYQIVFYLIAAKAGAWSPSDVPYDNLLNTAMPWLAVLAIGFFPAVTEEFISRMFSIPFLQKAFKNRMTWLALVLPAVIWGFGHAGYPNEPWYIRGVEVGLAGIVVGIVMLRWGILAALVWHYTVDALYTAFLLFRSENMYFMLTAAVAAGLLVVPLLLAVGAYIRKRGFLPEAGVRNMDDQGALQEEAPAPAAEPVVIPEAELSVYRPLPKGRRVLGLTLLVAGIAATLIPVSKLGDFIEYRVPKAEAERIFADSLRATGWANPDTLRVTAFADEEFKGTARPESYLLKQLGSVEAMNRLAVERLRFGRWHVFAWKPEHRLRYMGTVDARTGEIVSLYPWFPEEMPGDSLSTDSARALAEVFLAAQGEDLSQLEMKEHFEDANPARLDHRFTYEAKAGDPRHVGEAKYRRMVRVDGSVLSGSRAAWYKIPEEWERARRGTTTLRTVQKAVTYGLMAAAGVWMAVLLALQTRRGNVPWKRAFTLAIAPAALVALGMLNTFYLQQAEYVNRIETPWGVFQATAVIALIVATAMSYLGIVLALALLGALYPEARAELQPGARRRAARDALGAALGAAGIMLLIVTVQQWLEAWRPAWIAFDGWRIHDWLAAPVPLTMLSLAMIADVAMHAVMLGFFAYLWVGPMRKPHWRVLLLLGAVLMQIPGVAVEPGEWLLGMLSGAVIVAAAYVGLRFLIAGRAVPFLTAIMAAATTIMVASNLGLGNAKLTLHSVLLVVLVAVALSAWLYMGSKRAGRVDAPLRKDGDAVGA